MEQAWEILQLMRRLEAKGYGKYLKAYEKEMRRSRIPKIAHEVGAEVVKKFVEDGVKSYLREQIIADFIKTSLEENP